MKRLEYRSVQRLVCVDFIGDALKSNSQRIYREIFTSCRHSLLKMVFACTTILANNELLATRVALDSALLYEHFFDEHLSVLLHQSNLATNRKFEDHQFKFIQHKHTLKQTNKNTSSHTQAHTRTRTVS